MTIITKAIGDEITLTTIELKVKRVEEKQTITSQFGFPATAKEGAKFIIVNVDITNITNKSFTIIVNAVYHKSYEVREPIEIRIYKDKVVILSFPGPDKSIRKSDLDSGIVIARRYRNRRIGEFLKELKLTEGRSTGIPKIIRSMINNGSTKPIFDTDDERTYFKVELQINGNFTSKNIEAQDKAQDRNFEIYSLSEIEIKILRVLSNSVASKTEIAAELGYKSIAGNIKRTFKVLLNKGLIEYTIPQKPNSKNQKYLITEKGVEALKL